MPESDFRSARLYAVNEPALTERSLSRLPRFWRTDLTDRDEARALGEVSCRATVVALRIFPEAAHRHVFEHAPTQRADGWLIWVAGRRVGGLLSR